MCWSARRSSKSGVDIPRVNTIILDRAERLGLAQMYQLRGRVGRSSVRAFAYLMTEPYRSLSEVAQRRLATIMEADDLGAGFQIALKDLEIRGAGNLLGAQQSGHIGAVGFTLFTQLLSEAVERAQAKRSGKKRVRRRQGTRVHVDLALPRFLPETYVEEIGLRMTLYQRLAAAESPDEVADFAQELDDRFGPLPLPASNLLGAVKLKVLASRIRCRVDSVGGRRRRCEARVRDHVSHQPRDASTSPGKSKSVQPNCATRRRVGWWSRRGRTCCRTCW